MTPPSEQPPVKSSWKELALFGGEPAFPEPLHVGRPNLPDRKAFQKAVDRIWETKSLSNNGPNVQELEQRFCELTGRQHAVAVCNATLGLQLVARALGLEGEVILPSFTFIATAHAFRWEGLTPVFADIDAETHCLSPADVEPLISDDTAAIVGVHLWGNRCAADFEKLAHGNGVHLVYDAAHALGVSTGLGEAEVYSLHATKIVNGFEGGVIVTDSDVLHHQLRSLRNFGFAGYDDVRGLGTNAKMSEVCAAMALLGLDELPAAIEHNSANRVAYERNLAEISGLHLIPLQEPANHQYVVLQVDEAAFGIGRDALVKALWAEGVLARRYFFPGCHRSDPYRWECLDAAERLPVTERLCREVMILPTGNSIGRSEIEAIGALIRTCQAASRRIHDFELDQAA